MLFRRVASSLCLLLGIVVGTLCSAPAFSIHLPLCDVANVSATDYDTYPGESVLNCGFWEFIDLENETEILYIVPADEGGTASNYYVPSCGIIFDQTTSEVRCTDTSGGFIAAPEVYDIYPEAYYPVYLSPDLSDGDASYTGAEVFSFYGGGSSSSSSGGGDYTGPTAEEVQQLFFDGATFATYGIATLCFIIGFVAGKRQ